MDGGRLNIALAAESKNTTHQRQIYEGLQNIDGMIEKWHQILLRASATL
jgi:hypothetical protein